MGLDGASVTWFANCETCGQPLAEYQVKYHLTHSPNADLIRGLNQNKIEYTMHREHVVQADEYRYALQCAKCFEEGKGCVKLAAPILDVKPAPTPKPLAIHKKMKSKSSDKEYDVTIYPEDGPDGKMLCTCDWAKYNSNQDQGRTMKWCTHVVQALKEVVDDLNN